MAGDEDQTTPLQRLKAEAFEHSCVMLDSYQDALHAAGHAAGYARGWQEGVERAKRDMHEAVAAIPICLAGASDTESKDG